LQLDDLLGEVKSIIHKQERAKRVSDYNVFKAISNETQQSEEPVVVSFTTCSYTSQFPVEMQRSAHTRRILLAMTVCSFMFCSGIFVVRDSSLSLLRRESMIRFFPSTLVQSLSGVADGVTAVNQIGDPLV
jgi:hypothetical protein